MEHSVQETGVVANHKDNFMLTKKYKSDPCACSTCYDLCELSWVLHLSKETHCTYMFVCVMLVPSIFTTIHNYNNHYICVDICVDWTKSITTAQVWNPLRRFELQCSNVLAIAMVWNWLRALKTSEQIWHQLAHLVHWQYHRACAQKKCNRSNCVVSKPRRQTFQASSVLENWAKTQSNSMRLRTRFECSLR